MKFQPGPGYCAPAAIQNAARALGLKVKVDRIAKYAGTTAAEGTTQHGVKQAIERLKLSHIDISEPDLVAAADVLYGHVLNGGSAIILTERGNHWETVIGVIGSGFVVFDPQNLTRNKEENGVHVVPREELADYWTPFEGFHYAILVRREKTTAAPRPKRQKPAVRDPELPLQEGPPQQ